MTTIRQIFDSHFHIIDPAFPLVANHGFLPDPFTAEHYLAEVADLPIVAGTVVWGSFQEFDIGYLRAALARLGSSFVGVANVSGQASDDQLRELADAHIRGIRFNLYRGGSEDISHLVELGLRAWDVAGLHVEIYLDAADLEALAASIRRLPRVSIDHLGMTEHHRPTLLRLVDAGLRVKATGFGRTLLDVRQSLRDIHEANPKALMFGTDLPGTRARRPFDRDDIALIGEALGDAALPGVLHDNAAAFYRSADLD